MTFPLFVFHNILSGGLAHIIVSSLWGELRFGGIKESKLPWGSKLPWEKWGNTIRWGELACLA